MGGCASVKQDTELDPELAIANSQNQFGANQGDASLASFLHDVEAEDVVSPQLQELDKSVIRTKTSYWSRFLGKAKGSTSDKSPSQNTPVKSNPVIMTSPRRHTGGVPSKSQSPASTQASESSEGPVNSMFMGSGGTQNLSASLDTVLKTPSNSPLKPLPPIKPREPTTPLTTPKQPPPQDFTATLPNEVKPALDTRKSFILATDLKMSEPRPPVETPTPAPTAVVTPTPVQQPVETVKPPLQVNVVEAQDQRLDLGRTHTIDPSMMTTSTEKKPVEESFEILHMRKHLEDPRGLFYFQECLKEHLAVENLYFWLAVQDFKKETGDIPAHAKKIFQKFFLSSSEYEINISYIKKQRIQKRAMANDWAIDMYDELSKDCWRILTHYWVPHYRPETTASVYYKNYLLERMGQPVLPMTKTASPSRDTPDLL